MMDALTPEVKAVLDSIEAAGWTAKPAGSGSDGHYIVTTPGQPRPITFYTTASGLEQASSLLARLGIKAAIKARAAERDREARLAAKRAESQARAIKMAAGPYAPPEVMDSAFFFTRHPAPTFRWVLMTPAIAAEILRRSNGNNRELSRAHILYLRSLIEAGQWRLTHQGIAFDSNGVLQDGQHRLSAIVAADEVTAIGCFVGMDPENFKFIDEGKLRSASDVLGMLTGSGRPPAMATAIRHISAYGRSYETGNVRLALRVKIANGELVKFFLADRENIVRCCEWARQVGRKAEIPVAALSVSRYLIEQANGPTDYVDRFFHGVVTGGKPGGSRSGLDIDDPRVRLASNLRNRRLNGITTTTLDVVVLVIMAWNHVIEGSRPGHLKWPQGTRAPRPSICKPGESAMPPMLADGT